MLKSYYYAQTFISMQEVVSTVTSIITIAKNSVQGWLTEKNSPFTKSYYYY
jgi:hypothetical protein